MANIALAVSPGIFATGGVATSAVKYQFYTKAGAAIGSATATGVFELGSTGCYGVADPSFGGTEAFVVWTDTRDGTAFGIEVLDFRLPNVGTGVAGALLTSGTGTAQLSVASGIASVNVTQWLGGTIPAVNVTGVPLVDAKYLLGTVFPTPTVAGVPNVNVKTINDVATTPVTTIKAVQGLAVDGVITTVTNQLALATIVSAIWQDTTAGDFTVALSIGKSVMNGVALGTGLTINGLTNLPAITTDWLSAAGVSAAAVTKIQAGLSTLTQTQVTGGAYSLASASAVLGDPRMANLDAAVSSRMATFSYTAPDNSGISAIKAKTDQLAFTVANQVDANALSGGGTPPTTSEIADEVQTRTIAGVTLVDRVILNDDMRGTDGAALASDWTAARAGYLDNLDVGGPVASHADIAAINQSASKHLLIQTVGQYERPESGVTVYPVEVRTFSAATGAAVDADLTPNVSAIGLVSGGIGGNIGAATNPATGIYRYPYTVSAGDIQEPIRFDVSATINGDTFTLSCYTQVVDVVSTTWNSTNAANLTAIFNKLPSGGIADTSDAQAVRAVTDSLVMTGGKLWVLNENGDPLFNAATDDVTLAALQPAVTFDALTVTGDFGSGSLTVAGLLTANLAPSTLAGFFLTDTTKVYADAVNGSAVKETALGVVGESFGSGPYAVVITVDDGAAALQHAGVRISEIGNDSNYVAGFTDSGGAVSFSLEALDYTVAIAKAGFTFTPVDLTISANAAQTYSLTAQSAIVPPSDPLLCTIYGDLIFSNGNAAAGVAVTMSLLGAGPYTAGGIIVRTAVSVTTDAQGHFAADVIRTDAIDQSGALWRVACPAAVLLVETVAESGTLHITA